MIRAALKMIRIPIRVHGWGGLGSQIFACVVAKRLATLFPARKVVLIFHSSGVTRRSIEVPQEFTFGLTVITQDDFYPWSKEGGGIILQPTRISQIRNRVTLLFERIGLLARLNTEQEFSKLKPHVYEVRGHYTQILLTSEEVSWVANCLDISATAKELQNQSPAALHLRLGDLLTLKSKTHINLSRLSSAIRLISPQREVIVFSDSEPSEVEDLLRESFNGIEYRVRMEPALNVIQESALCEIFVGTNSKISLWIAIIRRGLSLGNITMLPKEISLQLEKLVPEPRSIPLTLEY